MWILFYLTCSKFGIMQFHFRPLATLGPDKSCVPENFDMLATQKEFTSESPEILEAKDHVSQVWGENSSSSGHDAFSLS
jgi:hypothetical protein